MKKTRTIIYISIVVTVLALGIIAILSMPNEKSPQTAGELIDTGNKYLLELSYDKAVIAFTEAIEIEPRNADSYIGLAKAYIGLGDNEKAIGVLEKGLEVTGDERIRDKLDELISNDEEIVEGSSIALNDDAESEDNDFSEDPTVNLYIPNKITVLREYKSMNSTILNYDSLDLTYDNYKFKLRFSDKKKDGKTTVVNNPTVSLYAGFNENLFMQVNRSNDFLDIRYFENIDYISINAQHPIFSIYEDIDVDDVNYSLNTAQKGTETYADNGSSNSTYNSEGYLIKRTYDNQEYTSTYEYDSDWNLLKEIRDNYYSGTQIMHLVYENGKLVKQYYEHENMNIVNNCRYGYDEQGRRKSIALYHLDEMEYQLFYDYDDYGNIIAISVYDSINNLIEKVDIEYKIIKVSEECVKKCESEFNFRLNR